MNKKDFMENLLLVKEAGNPLVVEVKVKCNKHSELTISHPNDIDDKISYYENNFNDNMESKTNPNVVVLGIKYYLSDFIQEFVM